MKKSVKMFVALFVLLGFVMMVGSSFGAALSSIGFIDVQKVFKGYSETSKAQEQLAKKESVFKKEFEDSQKQLEAAKADKKSDKDIEALTKKLEEKLAPKREELMKINEELTSRLQKDIVNSVKAVAKNLGLETVLDKQVVIIGGMDISDMVINKLNEKK